LLPAAAPCLDCAPDPTTIGHDYVEGALHSGLRLRNEAPQLFQYVVAESGPWHIGLVGTHKTQRNDDVKLILLNLGKINAGADIAHEAFKLTPIPSV
jgi:hypothetical protein